MSTAEALDAPGGISLDLLSKVAAELKALQGLPYLFARTSHGDELTLHFGVARPHTHPKLKERARGTYVLSLRGSSWMLRSGTRPMLIGSGVVPVMPALGPLKPFNVTALESGAFIAPNAEVSRAVPFDVEPLNAIGLTVELSDGSWFLILPTPPDRDGDDPPGPADWELLTPTTLLRVGPGPAYSVEQNGLQRS